MEVRRRQAGDVEAVACVAAAVRRLDRYPPRLPDLFSSQEAVAAWVVVDAGAVIGHVALHPVSAEPVMALAAEATGWPTERLLVVARLLVAPTVRRRGVGRMLLNHAVAEAHTRDRWPVLDVAANSTGPRPL